MRHEGLTGSGVGREAHRTVGDDRGLIRSTADERAAGTLTERAVRDVAASLRQHGAAIILDAVNLECCDRSTRGDAGGARRRRRKAALARRPWARAARSAAPRLEHLHADIFANPIAVSVARTLLGPGINLSLYTGNTSARPHDRRGRCIGTSTCLIGPDRPAAAGVAPSSTSHPSIPASRSPVRRRAPVGTRSESPPGRADGSPGLRALRRARQRCRLADFT